MMDIPAIDEAVTRDAGARAEPAPFGSIEWVVREGDPNGAEQSVALAVFDPGSSNAEHIHPNCEEIVFVLDGEMEHTLGVESTILRRGDLILVPRDAAHRIINHGPGPCRVLIVFSSPDRQFVPTGV
jgi:quercetin dioxygenase-like cupin family protein